MPLVSATLIAGYDGETRDRLARALTDAVVTVVPAAPDAVIVTLNELAPDQWYRGGTQRRPAPALPDPAAVALDFLRAMEARDLDTARSHLGAGFVMTFPTGKRMTDLQEMVDWSATRYQGVTKSFERVETVPGSPAVVWCFGTLAGRWPDGAPFSGIRFTDRFEITAGRITRQDVWNDMASAAAARETS